jgi:inhibitor of KinA sporulation pathway (predicted exonuclease)
MELSKEQRIAIETLATDNVSLSSVAGSGKTTTVLGIAAAYPEKKILFLTYNRALKDEVDEKCKARGLQNISVYTYHGFSGSVYGCAVNTTQKMRDLIVRDAPIRRSLKFDILVIDEVQDMVNIYFALISKFIQDSGQKFRIMVLGDDMQCIYSFLGADPRYLLLPHLLFQCDFRFLRLSTSYRITVSMASFINEMLYGREVITAVKPGKPVTYLYMENNTSVNWLVAEIQNTLIKNERYSCDEIAVLAPSVNYKGDALELEKELVHRGIPCYVNKTADTEKSSRQETEGKLWISSFHRFKGRERKVIIVFGFDNSYMRRRYKASSECPNELYVASTRALDRLYLVHDNKQPPLQFLKRNFHDLWRMPYVNMVASGKDVVENTCDNTQLSFTAESLCRFIHPTFEPKLNELCGSLFRKLDITKSTSISDSDSKHPIQLTTVVKSSTGLSEKVMDVNSVALKMGYEARCGGVICKKHERLRAGARSFRKNAARFASLCSTQLEVSDLSIEDYCLLGVWYLSDKEHTQYRFVQIERFDWLSDAEAREVWEVMDLEILSPSLSASPASPGPVSGSGSSPDALMFDVDLSQGQLHRLFDDDIEKYDFYSPIYRFISERIDPKFEGNIDISVELDILGDENIWDVLFSAEEDVSLERRLQAVVKGWLWDKLLSGHFGGRNLRIFHVLSRSVFVLDLERHRHAIDDIMEILLRNKLQPHVRLGDDEFVADNLGFRETLRKEGFVNTTLAAALKEASESSVEPRYIRRMILDTETTGTNPTSDAVIQLSYIVVDGDWNVVVEVDDFVCLPDWFDRRRDICTNVHGHSNATLVSRGKDFEQVMETFFGHLRNVSHVIGHNVDFDMRMLQGNLTANGHYSSSKWGIELRSKPLICTMRDLSPLCGMRDSKGNLRRNVSQEDCYRILVKEVCYGSHNALNDVRNLGRILRAVTGDEVLLGRLSSWEDGSCENSLERHTVEELKRMAKEKGIKGLSKMKKSDLIHILTQKPAKSI